MQATAKRCIYSALPMQVFMIHAIKKPLTDGLYLFFMRDMSLRRKRAALRWIFASLHNMGKLPEPTIENTWHPNTHNLILLRAWAFEKWHFLNHFKKIINFAIIIHAFDPPWRWIMETVLRDALKMRWSGQVYWDWWRDVRNLIILRRDFLNRCHLNETRCGFVKYLFNTLLVLYILLPPVRLIFQAFLEKVKEMKWEDRMYGHKSAPNWDWWRESAS